MAIPAPILALGVELIKAKLSKKKVSKEEVKEKAVEALSKTLSEAPVTTGLGTAAGVGALLMDTETLLQILPVIPADHHVWVLSVMYVTSAILILSGTK